MARAGSRDLAAYFMRAAGVAAVWIDAAGHVGAQDVAEVEIEDDGRIVYCCERGVHFTLAYRLYEWKRGVAADQVAAAAKLEEIAELGGVGLTPHHVAAERACEAVAEIDRKFERLQAQGGLKELNAAFRAARAEDPSLRYADFVAAKKAAVIEAMAEGAMAGPSSPEPAN